MTRTELAITATPLPASPLKRHLPAQELHTFATRPGGRSDRRESGEGRLVAPEWERNRRGGRAQRRFVLICIQAVQTHLQPTTRPRSFPPPLPACTGLTLTVLDLFSASEETLTRRQALGL